MKDPETNKYLHKYIGGSNQKCKICNFSQEDHLDLNIGIDNLQDEEIRLNVGEIKTNRQDIQTEIKKVELDIPQSVLEDFDNPNICRICFNNKLEDNNKIIFNCQHIFCQDCITNYLTSLINDGMVLNIRCLYGGCPRNFTHEEIRKFVSAENWRKYTKFIRSKAAFSSPDYKNCPYPDCEQIVQIDPFEVQIFNECNDNHRFCSKCLELAWHESGRCEKVLPFNY